MGWVKLTLYFKVAHVYLCHFSVDTDMFFFMVLRNNRLYCAWGPMDHREFLGLFITFKACVHVNQCGSAVGRLLFPF